jgi:hypothetical protein
MPGVSVKAKNILTSLAIIASKERLFAKELGV